MDRRADGLAALVLAVAAIAHVPPAAAEDPAIVVTATRLAPRVAEFASSTTVIDRAEIAALPAASVADLLQQIAGVHVDQPGGRGGVSSVYLRGADPNYTLVLIDGVAVNDPTNSRGGSVDLSKLNTAAVERIEIVRGAVSGVYGSGAMAGAINIVTRRAGAVARSSISARAGSHGFAEGWVSFATPVASGDLAATLSTARERNDASSFDGQDFSGGVGLALSDAAELRLDFGRVHYRASAFPDDSGGPVHAVLRALNETRSTQDRLGLRFARTVSSGLELAARVQRHETTGDEISPGVAPGVRDPLGLPASRTATQFGRTVLGVEARSRLGDAGSLAVGVEGTHESGSSDGTLDFGAFALPAHLGLSRTTRSAFAEGRYRAGPAVHLQGSIRLDRAQAHSVTSGSAGIVLHPAGTPWTVRANYATGFKLPSFFALGHPLIGNPELRPEHSRSGDLALGWISPGRIHELDASVFRSRFRDAIDFDPGPPPRLVNRSAIVARGSEFSYRGRIAPALRANASLALVDATVVGSDEPLRNRPQRKASAALLWFPGAGTSASATLVHVGKRADSSIPTGPATLSAYTRLDLQFAWRGAEWLEFSIALRNALDTRYEEAVGFPGLRRQVIAGARVDL